MKKLFVVLLALTVVVGWSVSVACAAPYFSGNLGAVWVEDSDIEDEWGDSAELSFDAGFGITGAIGNDFGNGFRLEGELGYRTNDMDEIDFDGDKFNIEGDVSTLSFMANGFYDFMPSNTVSPFIGAGIGLANVEGDIDYLGDDDDTVFAYQFAAGLAFSVNPQTKIDVQYRYFATDDPEFEDLEGEYGTHNAMLGLRVNF